MAKAPVKKTAAAPVAVAKPVRKTPAPTAAPEGKMPAVTIEQPALEQELTAMDFYLDAARAVDKTFADPTPKESEQAFYKRLIGTLANEEAPNASEPNKLPIWDSLESTAIGDIQPWYLVGVDNVEAGTPVAALSGYASFKAAQAVKTKAQGAEKGAGLARYREQKAADKAASIVTEKKVKAVVVKEPKGPGITQKVRDIIVVNLDVDLEKLKVLTADLGVNPSTLSTLRSDVLATVGALRRTGVLKD